MNSAERAENRRVGSLRAQRALKSAGIDTESPVDVFGAIEEQRVWLIFQMLDTLYGAYRRQENPGIVLHAGHPFRLQRFTAAHELGHHLLGHDVSVDSRDEVEGQGGSLPAQEIQAQAFAATFLMPVQLVNRALSQRSLSRRPGIISPAEAYLLSLELGASYMATITQLRALDRITFANARALSKSRPIDIKTELAAGERPAISRADVWFLRSSDNGRHLRVLPGDEIHAYLSELPTTGYRWDPVDSTGAVEVVGNTTVAQDDGQGSTIGAARDRHLWWRALNPSSGSVIAELSRSFDPESVVDRFAVELEVASPRTGSAPSGVSRRQLQLA